MLYEILDDNYANVTIPFVLDESSTISNKATLHYRITYAGKIASEGYAYFYKLSEDPDLTKTFSYTIPNTVVSPFFGTPMYTIEVGSQLDNEEEPGFIPGNSLGLTSFSKADKIVTLNQLKPTIYGYKRIVSNSDCDARISYDYGSAISYTIPKPSFKFASNPITITAVNNASSTIDYGDWDMVQDIFKPCRIPHIHREEIASNQDSTEEDYIQFLDINDYTKLENGEDSLITTAASGYDYFIQINGNYFKYMNQFEKNGIQYTLFCDIPITKYFKANAFIGEDGEECPYLYIGMFKGVYNTSEDMYETNGAARKATANNTIQKIYKACATSRENGNSYWPMSYVQYDYIRSLLTMFFKTDNLQKACGIGVGYGSGSQQNNSVPSTLKDLFLNQVYVATPTGMTASNKPVYILGMQDLWGNMCQYLAGLILNRGDWIGRAYPPFNVSGEGYEFTGQTISPLSTNNAYIQYGKISSNLGCWLPCYAKTPAAANTYHCDQLTYGNLTTANYGVMTKGEPGNSAGQGGPYGLTVIDPATTSPSNITMRVAFVSQH